ncbi:leucine-rich repeat domain-containing protein [Anaeromicropila herbilytica]|uniref:Leucine-rich repeat domain-containing protein n=1 Tax=Anaeromicropila herbilytica TaxID=2785025 RepID=A0A7R7ELY0_9FIRM|nr:hypothetical protein [Anaeromicropila herbilytica]BCN31183.1 hypothetical protein bsdtb5_24780 [Anaeromicropila herbilytica]
MDCHEFCDGRNQDDIFTEERENYILINNQIPDVGLQAAINKALNKRALNEITIEDLESLTGILDARDYRIKSIEGIQYAKNISCLLLQHNLITDITPLSQLSSLEYLSVNYNHICEFPCMKGMFHLKKIYFSFNHIIDISPLVQIPSLYSVYGINQKIKLKPVQISLNNEAIMTLSCIQDRFSEFELNEDSIIPYGVYDKCNQTITYFDMNDGDNVYFTFNKKYRNRFTGKTLLISGNVEATVKG